MTDGPGRGLVLNRGRIAILVAVVALVIALVLIAVINEDPEQEVTDVVLAYGQAPEGEACEYLSADALARLGGEEGCAEQFREVPGVDFEIESLTVEEETAAVRVLNPETETPVDLQLVEEEGDWKISSFPGLETIVPPEQEEEPLPPPTDTGAAETTAPETETDEGTTTEETAP